MFRDIPTMEEPLKLLHVSASARPFRSDQQERGSHSRRLTGQFLDRWLSTRPKDDVLERDVGAVSPAPVTFDWIRGVFSDPASHDAAIGSALRESDLLAAELAAADLILIGTPIYNFGMPVQLKAWIDNVVRIGLTFTVSPEGIAAPLMDPNKRLILLRARGDRDCGEADHGGPDLIVEGVRRPMAYIGIGRFDVVSIDGFVAQMSRRFSFPL